MGPTAAAPVSLASGQPGLHAPCCPDPVPAAGCLCRAPRLRPDAPRTPEAARGVGPALRAVLPHRGARAGGGARRSGATSVLPAAPPPDASREPGGRCGHGRSAPACGSGTTTRDRAQGPPNVPSHSPWGATCREVAGAAGDGCEGSRLRCPASHARQRPRCAPRRAPSPGVTEQTAGHSGAPATRSGRPASPVRGRGVTWSVLRPLTGDTHERHGSDSTSRPVRPVTVGHALGSVRSGLAAGRPPTGKAGLGPRLPRGDSGDRVGAAPSTAGRALGHRFLSVLGGCSASRVGRESWGRLGTRRCQVRRGTQERVLEGAQAAPRSPAAPHQHPPTPHSHLGALSAAAIGAVLVPPI